MPDIANVFRNALRIVNVCHGQMVKVPAGHCAGVVTGNAVYQPLMGQDSATRPRWQLYGQVKNLGRAQESGGGRGG
jgi:hypothetical protein